MVPHRGRSHPRLPRRYRISRIMGGFADEDFPPGGMRFPFARAAGRFARTGATGRVSSFLRSSSIRRRLAVDHHPSVRSALGEARPEPRVLLLRALVLRLHLPEPRLHLSDPALRSPDPDGFRGPGAREFRADPAARRRLAPSRREPGREGDQYRRGDTREQEQLAAPDLPALGVHRGLLLPAHRTTPARAVSSTATASRPPEGPLSGFPVQSAAAPGARPCMRAWGSSPEAESAS